jgi:ribokinase
VVVAGSFMMDLVVSTPRRPERGETVFGSGFDVFLGGKGANQAIAAARSGASVAMVGRLGADDFGRQFLDCLAREGIDASHVVVDDVEGTGVGAPVVELGGENSIVVIPRANHRVTPHDVRAAAPVLTAADVVLLQLELPIEAVREAARVAADADALVVLNPAPAVDHLDGFAGLVDVLVPNEGEATRLTGEEDPATAARALHERFGCAVVVTVGEQGAWVVENGQVEQVPAHAVEAVDTVGAGDAFCGALGARLAGGDRLPDAVRYATAAAAISVTRRGAEPAMPTAADIQTFLATRRADETRAAV